MEIFQGTILPYTAIVVFLSGTLLKIMAWLRTPVPFHLTLFPVPESGVKRAFAIAGELILCRTLFREDKALWLRVWLFHLSLALVICGHALGIFFLRNQFVLLGADPNTSRFLSGLLGGMTGIVMLVSLATLLAGRITNPVTRMLSVPEDFFSLMLLLAICLTGLLMYLPGFHVELPAVRTYLGGLLAMRPVPMPHSPVFRVHFALVNLLLLWFPFSRLIHFAGYFVNRLMLSEPPPVYPTGDGIAPRSPFAADRGRLDLPISRKATGGTGGDMP